MTFTLGTAILLGPAVALAVRVLVEVFTANCGQILVRLIADNLIVAPVD